MGSQRRGPGRPPQAVKRERWAVLVAQGVGNSDACRIVGVDRSSGRRRRNGYNARDLRRACAALSAGEGRLSRKFAASGISAR